MAKTGVYLDESNDDDEPVRHVFCPQGSSGAHTWADIALCSSSFPAGKPHSRAPICPDCINAAGQVATLYRKLTGGK
jgi:hypothetical protein